MRRNELTNSAVDNNADVNNTATPTLTDEQKQSMVTAMKIA